MKNQWLYHHKKGFFLAVFFITALVVYACGGGGGSSGGGVSGADVFITDDMSDDFERVKINLCKVEFQNSQTKSRVTVFESLSCDQIDITELSGILEQLPGTLPPGNYNRVFLTVGKTLILVDKNGNELYPPLAEKQHGKSWTTCSGEQCVIEVTGAVNVVNKGNVVLDFDLKQFKYNHDGTVTVKIVLDAEGSGYKGYHHRKDKKFKVKGVIDSIDPTAQSFELIVFKAKGFIPPTNIITVQTNGTKYTCDDDEYDDDSCPVQSFGDLMPGMRVKAHGEWNETDMIFKATKVIVDEDDDIDFVQCTVPERSITDFTNRIMQPEIESYTYDFNDTDYSITIIDKDTTMERTILITKETRIKDETGESERMICADEIPALTNVQEVEIDYYSALDASNNTVYVAFKIEFEGYE